MTNLDDVLQSLVLTQVDIDRYTAINADSGHGVVFGGQLMAQSIIAGLTGHGDKRVQTLQTVFVRSGSPDAPVEIAVERLHSGRSMASSSVRVSQGDRLCTQSTVMLTSVEPDFISHSTPDIPTSTPDDCEPVDYIDGWEIRIVDNIDISDPGLVGPPTLDVWTRFGARSKLADSVTTGIDISGIDIAGIDEALLAFASDGFLIGTAMRPHDGVGQSLAHRSISTGVLSHTITFHQPFSASDWHLVAHESPFAGQGRSFGRAMVTDATSRLVASFSQDAMIRPMGDSPKAL